MTRRLRSSMRIGVAVIVAVALGACARDEVRPTGVAEKWLQEVSNQGRSGVRADAAERAAELGDPALMAKVVPAKPEKDERYFSDLEVGQAQISGDEALVPYRLTARLDGGDTEERTGTLHLTRAGNSWRVDDVRGPSEGLRVPSDGGPLPARAAGGHWIAALLLGVVLTAVCVALVEMQPRPARPEAAT